MRKEEVIKIQTCTLKVNINCDGCKRKVTKTLLKIEGVYKVDIDGEEGKVTISGNVDLATLIKKLKKKGKPAHIWGASEQNKHISDQFKNDNGKHVGGKIKNQEKSQQEGSSSGGDGRNKAAEIVDDVDDNVNDDDDDNEGYHTPL
ncbi:hypothetical protein R6Q59_029679 [Mikania micrantha]